MQLPVYQCRKWHLLVYGLAPSDADMHNSTRAQTDVFWEEF